MIVQASGHRLTTFDAYAELGLPADLRRYDRVGPDGPGTRDSWADRTVDEQPREDRRRDARALAAEKIDVLGTRSIEGPASPFNRDYLRAKRRSGHALARDGRDGRLPELPPEPIEVEAPQTAEGQPELISTARYWLPVKLSDGGDDAASVDWFRAQIVHDRRTARESVVLARGSSAAGRRPPRASPVPSRSHSSIDSRVARRRGDEIWERRLRQLREQDGGRVLVHFDDADPNADRRAPAAAHRHRALSDEILAARWTPARAARATTRVDAES